MAVLPTNYLDDILAASMGGKRRFRITHEDGSTEEVTIEDVSEYEQVGSPFGSGDVNKTNQAVNEKLDSADVVDPALATVLGFAADAKLTGDALSELNKNKIINVTIAKQSNYTISVLSVVLRNGIADCSITVNVITIPDSWVTIATLPHSCLPYKMVHKDVPFYNAIHDYSNIRLRITTSGSIQLARGEVGQDYAFHDTFVVV